MELLYALPLLGISILSGNSCHNLLKRFYYHPNFSNEQTRLGRLNTCAKSHSYSVERIQDLIKECLTLMPMFLYTILYHPNLLKSQFSQIQIYITYNNIECKLLLKNKIK